MRRRFASYNNKTTDLPLIIEALEDGLIVNFTNTCEYCIDGDEDWKILSKGTNTESINSGQALYFRGSLIPFHLSGIGNFTISKKCNIKGDCRSLLLNKILFNYAFYQLFKGCTTIKSVSEDFLPATTLTDSCYGYMFSGCTGLTQAPSLPATTLASYCYISMFSGCSNLNYIKMLATDITADNCLNGWVSNVSPTGTFVKHPEATWDVRGVNGVPEGWTIKFDGEEEGGTYDEYFGQIPPESTSLEFPLYITVPFVEANDVYRLYERQADNLSLQLREWFFENAECTEDFFETYYELYPDNIYLNGVKVRKMDVVLYKGESLENKEINIYLEQISSTSNVGLTNKGELNLLVFT